MTETNADSKVQDIMLAGASLRIYRDAPSWEGGRTAAIGSLDFPTEEGGFDLLGDACSRLSAEGFDSVVGPMAGDTWHAYRAVTRSDGAPPFLMEPRSGKHDVEALVASGFTTISRYVSSRAPVAKAGSSPIVHPDVTVEPWDGKGAEALLGYLFSMSTATFANNAFYKPIAREEFMAMYEPVVPRLDRDMILFAKDGKGDIVGFLFGLPDLAPDGKKRAVLKTYASMRRGTGRLLADRFHHVARDKGFDEVIHALMHADNVSKARSGMEGGSVFREYALFGKRLRP